MPNESLMLYKLIVLYILDKVEFPLTNQQLTDFVLEKGYTNYFTIQQVLSELVEDKFITCNVVRNSSFYEIAVSGGETLSFFYNKISAAIKNDIDDFLKKNKYKMRDANSTLADFREVRENEYITNLKVLERGLPIIEINLSVPTEADANLICDNWAKKSAEVYAKIFSALTANNE